MGCLIWWLRIGRLDNEVMVGILTDNMMDWCVLGNGVDGRGGAGIFFDCTCTYRTRVVVGEQMKECLLNTVWMWLLCGCLACLAADVVSVNDNKNHIRCCQ